MNIKAIASKLKIIAPTIASVLGSPAAGLLTKTALDSLTKSMDIPETSNDKEIISAIQSVDIQKIKQAENDFKLKMEQANISLEEIHAQDRANARKYYAVNRDVFTPALAWTIILGFFLTIIATLHVLTLPGEANQSVTTFLGMIIGSVGTLTTQIASFYWGSSNREHKNSIMTQDNNNGR